MIEYDKENQEWVFKDKKVVLTDNDTERIKYTDNPDYFEKMADKHDFITIESVEDFEPTDEQKERLDDINSIETHQNFTGTYINYIKTGELPTDYIGKLKDLKVKKEQNSQDSDISDMLFDLMEKGVI